ncbi:hypothetical protein SLE2022_403220 [Rubroshorea leprosula]
MCKESRIAGGEIGNEERRKSERVNGTREKKSVEDAVSREKKEKEDTEKAYREVKLEEWSPLLAPLRVSLARRRKMGERDESHEMDSVERRGEVKGETLSTLAPAFLIW